MGYFPRKGFLDSPSSIKKCTKLFSFYYMDNKMNLTTNNLFIFNRASRVNCGRSAGPCILAAAQGRIS